jgi:midasin (ATPase involved in ribosome maturation)
MVTNEFFEKLVWKIHFRFEKVLKRMNGTTHYEDGDPLRVEHLGKDAINVSFVGKPGTGKSHNVHAAAAACGIPIYVVNLSHNTDEDRFEGLTKIVDGKPMAIPTEAVKCFKYGGILLLEEVNLAQAAVVMGALGQAIEDPYILKQNGYHDIYRHPLCVVASTTNKGTSGTKTVAEQFSNRFIISYRMNDPVSNEFVDRLIKLTGEDRDICEKVYDCYVKVVDFINTENALADVDKILNSLSLRTCVGAIQNMQEGSSFVEAIQDSIIGKIAEQDDAVAENCKALVNAISFKRKK